MKALAVVGVLAVFAGLFVVGYIGFKNDCIGAENALEAKYKENRSIYDNGWKTVVEKMQVSEVAYDKLQELYAGIMSGRYGPEGSRAMLQVIREDNPKADLKLFEQVQQSVEIFRNRFVQAQKELADRTQLYKDRFQKFPGSLYNGMAGFPRVDLAKYEMVTSARTEKVFEEKKDEPLDLRPKKP